MFKKISNEGLLLLEKMVNNFDPDYMVENIEKMPKIEGYSLAANGCLYRNDNHGFLTSLMEKMFNDRVKYKKLMLEAKKRYEKTKSSEDEKLISRYHNFQMAKKIQLNSLYGALSNIYFRWFNFDNAESITTSGQLTIKYVDKIVNDYLNKMLKTKNKDYIIASDTDSIYIELGELVKHLNTDDEGFIVSVLDAFCEKQMQPHLEKHFNILANSMNAYQQKMQMKRETIANKGIWRGKKMYILNSWNVEGVQYAEPQLKIQGIEAVRSSTPKACRDNIKKALSIIMNKDEVDFHKFVADFETKFLTLPFEEVAFPRGVNGMKKYYDPNYVYQKGTPIHVKGALLFNDMIKTYSLDNIAPISDGDKIRFAYLKMPNPVHDHVIAAPDNLPDEFKLDKYIDRELQFTKSFLEPIRSIADVIGWTVKKERTLEDFFE